MTETLRMRLPGRLRSVRPIEAAAPSHVAQPARPAALVRAEAEMRARFEQQLETEKAHLRQALAALQKAAAEFQRVQADLTREAEEQLLTLGLCIARKVLMQEIQAERYQIDPIIREALTRISARQDVVVHLNPRDLERSTLAHETSREGGGGLTFVADASVQPADCRLETPEGVVDSQMQTHLDQIGGALRALE